MSIRWRVLCILMKLYAISDLHLGHVSNQQALVALPYFPNDWLILAGDVGETEAHLEFALSILTRRFARIIWVPGNHDLWTLPTSGEKLGGEAKYQRLVSLCRSFGVLTPEDPYALWSGEGNPCLLAPLFTLYDYSFRPDHLSDNEALFWAERSGVVCADEFLLHPDPYPSRVSWCHARCEYSEQRLQAAAASGPILLINHFPLRGDLVRLPGLPSFSLWCGTRRTEDWHIRFPVLGVVYGHLHRRGKVSRNGVEFYEVSLGYPRDWKYERGIHSYLRQILPKPLMPSLERYVNHAC